MVTTEVPLQWGFQSSTKNPTTPKWLSRWTSSPPSSRMIWICVYCIFRWFPSNLPLGRKIANSGADPSRLPRNKRKVAFNWFWRVKPESVRRVLLGWGWCFLKQSSPHLPLGMINTIERSFFSNNNFNTNKIVWYWCGMTYILIVWKKFKFKSF